MATFLENNKIVRHWPPEPAADTTITPDTGVDMHGFSTCVFLVPLGDIGSGASMSIEVHQSDDDGDTDQYSALDDTGYTIVDTDDDQCVVVEVSRAVKRYLKCIVNRSVQNSEIGGIIAVLGGARSGPVTQDATVIGKEIFTSPAEGSP